MIRRGATLVLEPLVRRSTAAGADAPEAHPIGV